MKITNGMLTGVAIVTGAIALTLFAAIGAKALIRPQPSALTTKSAPEIEFRAPVDPPRPKEPTIGERMIAAKHLSEVLPIITREFGDSTNQIDPAAQVFAIWSVDKLYWDELNLIPETKRALVMKDPTSERGKRLCVSGTVTQISVERSTGEMLTIGILMTSSVDFVRFIAVRSSGEIVENTAARICGIVIGTNSYSNTGGGVTHAAMLVGMFDLPENRAIRAPGVAAQ